jgi:hypothetical protein
MSRNGVAGFNLLDNNFSRDVSDVSDLGTALKRFQQPKKNVFKEVARGRMSMPRSVNEGFYGYEARDGPDVAPFVYVTLQSNANLKVTWDMPNLTRWTSSPVNHYYIILRELENARNIYIGRTENATREFTVDLSSKYYLSIVGGRVSDPPTYNIKDNMIYDILIYAVDDIQAPKNAQLNNNRLPNIYPENSRKIGQSYSFNLMKQSGAPTNVSVVGGDSKASVTWTAPPAVQRGETSATRNNTIFNIKNKGYNITFTPTFINEYLRKIIVTNDIISDSITVDPPTSAEILSLTNSTIYKITVKAISYIGNSLSQASTEVSLNLTGVVPPPRTRDVIIAEEKAEEERLARLAAAKEVADRELAIRTTIGTATNLRLTALPEYGHFLIEWDSPFSAHDFTKKVLVKLDLGNITFSWFTDAGSTGNQFRGPEGGTRYKITNSGNYHSIYIILPDAKKATNKRNIVATLQYNGFYYSNTKYTTEQLYGPVLTSNSVSIEGVPSTSIGNSSSGLPGMLAVTPTAEGSQQAADKLAADKLAADKLAADKLAADKLAADKLAADKLAADKLAADKLAADKLAADKLAADKLAADKLAADKLVADRLAAQAAQQLADRATADRLAADRLTAEAADRLAADRLAAQQLAAQQLADRAIADRIAADRATADRIATDRATADRLAADRTTADRLAAQAAQAAQAAKEAQAQQNLEEQIVQKLVQKAQQAVEEQRLETVRQSVPSQASQQMLRQTLKQTIQQEADQAIQQAVYEVTQEREGFRSWNADLQISGTTNPFSMISSAYDANPIIQLLVPALLLGAVCLFLVHGKFKN